MATGTSTVNTTVTLQSLPSIAARKRAVLASDKTVEDEVDGCARGERSSLLFVFSGVEGHSEISCMYMEA